MKNRKKGDITFKFSFYLMLCINAYLHPARNQSISWKNEKETRPPLYQNDNGSTMSVKLLRTNLH